MSKTYCFYIESVGGKFNGFTRAPVFQTRDITAFVAKISDVTHAYDSVYSINIKIVDDRNSYNPDWPFSPRYTEQYDFYIADKIQNDSALADLIRKKYRNNIYEMPTVVDKPAILTDIHDTEHILGGIHRNNISSGRLRGCKSAGIRPSRDVRAYGGPGPRHVNVGKTINWHVLDPDKDIVVDRNMHQIYPINTGKMPTQLQKILKQSEGR